MNIKNSILARNFDIILFLVASVITVIFLRDENHGMNGIYYQWIAGVLAIVTTFGLGTYLQRKIFPYFRPDKYLPDGAESMTFIDVTGTQFKMAMACGVFRLIFLLGILFVMNDMLGNQV